MSERVAFLPTGPSAWAPEREVALGLGDSIRFPSALPLGEPFEAEVERARG